MSAAHTADPNDRGRLDAERVPRVRLSGVTRRWGAGPLTSPHTAPALDSVSLAVSAGELVVVTGAAGAGKSTLLAVAAGDAPPSAGTAEFDGGPDPAPLRPQRIGGRPWEYGFLTVRQALVFHADLLALRDAALPRRHRFVPLMRDVGLAGRSRVRLGQLGALDRLRVVVAQALLAEPLLLCCDEPFAFLAPGERVVAARLLRRLAGRGISILVALREAEWLFGTGLMDRLIRLDRGRLVAEPVHTQAVLELAVPRPSEAFARLAKRLPSLAQRGRRLRVPLRGQTPESILALCRDAGVAVRASRVAEEAEPLPRRERSP